MHTPFTLLPLLGLGLIAVDASEQSAPEFKGFEITTDDGAHRLRIGGVAQADARVFGGGEPPPTLYVRRARLDVQARLARYFGARVHAEFAGSALSLLDAFVSVALVDEIQLRAGRMKAPIGLELLQSSSGVPFPERGLPTLLVPQRDVGAILHGNVAGVVVYDAGVFNGTRDGQNGAVVDADASKDVVARVLFSPFAHRDASLLEGLSVGLAGSWGRQHGALPEHRTAGRETFFRYTEQARAAGPRIRMAPQASWYAGPVGVVGELVQSTQGVADDWAEATLTSTAWQVAASVVVGGNAAASGAEVAAPLDPEQGRWGALEVAARVGQLAVDPETFSGGFAVPQDAASGATNLGAALNWWFAAGTRLGVGFDHTRFEGGAAFGDRADENVFVARLQLAF